MLLPQQWGTRLGELGTLARKLGLELLYPSSGINKALFTSECRVGIHRNIANDYMMVYAVNILSLFRTGGGNCVEFFSGGYIHKTN